MPSEASTDRYTGRCYCGALSLVARGAPQVVAYCHCADCRRWTGAPAPAFAAFGDVTLEPEGQILIKGGVNRWTCPTCGSAMAAQFDYLPGQTYVPLGVLDQAGHLRPTLHCHADKALPWAIHDDGLPRVEGSAREVLRHDG